MASDKVVSFRFPTDLVAAIDERAAEQNRPRGWVVEQAIRAYLDGNAELPRVDWSGSDECGGSGMTFQFELVLDLPGSTSAEGAMYLLRDDLINRLNRAGARNVNTRLRLLGGMMETNAAIAEYHKVQGAKESEPGDSENVPFAQGGILSPNVYTIGEPDPWEFMVCGTTWKETHEPMLLSSGFGAPIAPPPNTATYTINNIDPVAVAQAVAEALEERQPLVWQGDHGVSFVKDPSRAPCSSRTPGECSCRISTEHNEKVKLVFTNKCPNGCHHSEHETCSECPSSVIQERAETVETLGGSPDSGDGPGASA